MAGEPTCGRYARPMISDDGLLPWLARLRDEIPGAELVDAHTHLGANDPDGYRCGREELVAALEAIDARAYVFAMHEPDGYSDANDMVLAEAAASDGRLFPFCRLDPNDDPLAEARRCLASGARGVKLHPRAERFNLDHPALQDVFRLAHEHRLPILCHAGRGIPALGRRAIETCARYPGLRLILAHAGISDLSWIWREAPEHPNLFFDTAWWSPSDVQALFALVPPGQILMASDAPYGAPGFAAYLAMRHGLQVGLDADALREMLGGQALRLIDREEPRDLGPAPGIASLSRDPLLERVYSFLLSALGQMFNGVEPRETLALARLACGVPDDAPHLPIYEAILSLLDARAGYDPSGDGRPPRFAPGLHFIIAAAALARTPDVAVPDPPRFALEASGSPYG
jgi:predicted TIM-barrel fold metal-dependent hydrolase